MKGGDDDKWSNKMNYYRKKNSFIETLDDEVEEEDDDSGVQNLETGDPDDSEDNRSNDESSEEIETILEDFRTQIEELYAETKTEIESCDISRVMSTAALQMQIPKKIEELKKGILAPFDYGGIVAAIKSYLQNRSDEDEYEDEVLYKKMDDAYIKFEAKCQETIDKARNLFDDMGKLKDAEQHIATAQILFAAIRGYDIEQMKVENDLRRFVVKNKDKEVSYFFTPPDFDQDKVKVHYREFKTLFPGQNPQITSELYRKAMMKKTINPVLFEFIDDATSPTEKLKAANELPKKDRTAIINKVTKTPIDEIGLLTWYLDESYKNVIRSMNDSKIYKWIGEGSKEFGSYDRTKRKVYQRRLNKLTNKRREEPDDIHTTSMKAYIESIKAMARSRITLEEGGDYVDENEGGT